MIRIAISTLGCKTNAYESAAIIDGFGPGQYEIVPFESDADIYIINTCTVTNRTDYKSRNLIRKALARKAGNPLVKVIVTGCFAQRSADEIAAMGEIDLIADNQNKPDIARLLGSTDYRFEDIMSAREFNYRPVSRMIEHTRAFQKIQDGCDFYCSYCAVPHARGHNRSARLADVIDQARRFVAGGYKEIVLGGVNLGLYRDGDHGLAEVVEALQKLHGLELIRLSSLEPQLVTPELIDRIKACSKLCPHFHFALQSGCDSVLERMGRHYRTGEVEQLLSQVYRAWPDAAVGFDVITGFPGESEAEFAATRTFLAGLQFAYLHVFSYSKRKGTPAAVMPGQVPNNVKTERTNRLMGLSNNKRFDYLEALLNSGVILRGVCEEHWEDCTIMLSDHSARCYLPGHLPLGKVARLRPSALWFDGLA